MCWLDYGWVAYWVAWVGWDAWDGCVDWVVWDVWVGLGKNYYYT